MIKRLATNIDQEISLILKKVTCNLITYDNKKRQKREASWILMLTSLKPLNVKL